MVDTIYALSTVPAKSGVAIIRISGPDACRVLAYFSCPPSPTARHAYYADFIVSDTSEAIDSGIFIYFCAPYSFTGEDTIEIQCHGSLAVIQSFLKHLSYIPDFRMAEPGEFSRRAFDNGKMDLTQAEGLADLIESETLAQQQQALRQMYGGLGKVYDEWRSQLINIIAYLEAYIDFPDEDLPDSLISNVHDNVSSLISSLTQHLDDSQVGEKLREGLQVIIIGPPNAGKSSFLNALAQRDVAIVSEEPGTTRDLVEVHLDLHGIPVTLIDTAGLRDTNNRIESEGVLRARNRMSSADIHIVLLDISNIPHVDDSFFSFLDTDNIPSKSCLLCLNKIDLVDPPLDSTLASLPTPYQALPLFPISVENNQGIERFLDELSPLVQSKISFTSSPVITRSRHREAIESCLERLSSFNFNGDLVLAVEDLRLAAHYLGKITGRIDVEDILDSLFSHFCIGK